MSVVEVEAEAVAVKVGVVYAEITLEDELARLPDPTVS